MVSTVSSNKSISLRDELIQLKRDWRTSAVYKSLFFAALLTVGVAGIIFMGGTLFSAAIAIVAVSSFAIYKIYQDYRQTRYTFNRAALAISERVS